MRKVIAFSVLIIIPVLLFAAFWLARPASSAPLDQGTRGVGPAWYDPEWHYRRPVTVTNSSTALSNYQVLVKLDSAFDFIHTQTDGDDLRVTASDGTTPLSFWVESWDNAGTKAWIWVKVPSLPAGKTVIYLYYGNTSSASASDGTATFEAYDGFENYAVGTVPTANLYNPGEWTRYADTPVLQRGASDSWDSAGATFASVISDTGTYSMYYHGWGTAPCASPSSCIGLATSPDGKTWTKHGSPVMVPGGTVTWDVDGVRVPMVWKEGPYDYRMIYTGSEGAIKQVGYAYSTDGINWTKHDDAVFNDPTWANNDTENWGVIKDSEVYYMWYGNGTAPREVGLATTTNLTGIWAASGTPIFESSDVGSDLRYSQYSPFTFKYGGYFYVLVPSYSSVSNYGRYYLYRSTTPDFTTRALVRVAHTVGASGQWDEEDSDTPFVLTSYITRTLYPSDQLWTYYAGAAPVSIWNEGLLIETNIGGALAEAALPTGVSWTDATGVVSITQFSDPVRQGLHSFEMHDTDGASRSLYARFASQEQGVIGAWMQRTNTSYGDFDIYLYGNGTLAAVGGLGREGVFRYWDLNPHDTGTRWYANTWYLVTLAFNAGTDKYDFIVYDQDLKEIVRVEGIGFSSTGGTSSIDTAMFYTSGGFVGYAYGDDFRLRKYTTSEPTILMRSYSDIQETRVITGMGTPDFSLVGITLTVQTQGNLTSLQVIQYFHNHPNGTYSNGTGGPYGTKTGQYWEIIPNHTGYTVDLTLPHNSVPDENDKVCRWTGTGTIWDCVASGFDAGKRIIWRTGITQLSEWATGNNVGPTVVRLKDMTATSRREKVVPAILAAGLVSLLAAGLLWRRRVRLHHQ
jgi:hypothetical protein